MKKTITVILALLACVTLGAQEPARDTAWTEEGVIGLKMTQVSLTNWSAGGVSSLAFDALLNYSADFKRDRHLWQNRLELAYGISSSKGERVRKTNDKIYLASTYGYKIAKSLYWSLLFKFQTQFYNGYNYDKPELDYISKFMAPAYITVGTGLTWTPRSYLTVTLAPASWRGTLVLDDRLSDEGAFGVDPGDKILHEFGANLKAEITYPIWENVKIYSRLELYSNYLEKPQNVDVHWDVQLNMSVNKWLSTTLTTNLVYDDNVKIVQKDGTAGSRVQFKEVLGVGLQFQF